MRRFINSISAVLGFLMIGVTLAVGWYQAIQIIDFAPAGFGSGGDKWCRTDTSNLCTVWPDRFSTIAFGVIVPVILGPFILVFFNTMKNPWSYKRQLIVWLSIMIASFSVYLSGLILYAIA